MDFLNKVKNNYKIIAESDKVDKLVQLLDDLGSEQRKYWETSDYASNYDHFIKEIPYNSTKEIQGQEFKNFYHSLTDDMKKKAWKWIQHNTEAVYQYYGSPARADDWSAATFLLNGDEEFQLSGIKEYDTLVKDMTDNELEEASKRSEEFYEPKNHTMYLNQGYSLLEFLVDIDALKEALSEQ